jgi:hypothetical protein
MHNKHEGLRFRELQFHFNNILNVNLVPLYRDTSPINVIFSSDHFIKIYKCTCQSKNKIIFLLIYKSVALQPYYQIFSGRVQIELFIMVSNVMAVNILLTNAVLRETGKLIHKVRMLHLVVKVYI